MFGWLKKKRRARPSDRDRHAALLAREVLAGRCRGVPTPPRWKQGTSRAAHEIRVYAWARRVIRHGAGLPRRNGR